uniref:Cytochrome c n=1 Tax=Desulfobacca acetoxidans TaxID=60893 RepID=A0A7V4G728_9BACT
MTRRLLVVTAAVAFALTAAWAADTGKDLVQRLGCMGCHSLAGKGGGKGPKFDGVGSRLTPEAIKKQIVSPRGRMPNFAHLKAEELDAVVQYLSGLK